jgi:metallophosphoesterase superfamily enzyme
MSRCDWVWVEGNHDGRAPETLGGALRETLHLGSLVLRHEPTEAAAPGEIAGHLHPCARVVGRGRSVRRRCFATDGARLVMPAFGAFTGGLNVCDEAYAKIFPDGARRWCSARIASCPRRMSACSAIRSDAAPSRAGSACR